MRKISSVGGMNRNNRLSTGPKKVTPPSVPEVKNPRASCSSFGSSENSSVYEESDSFAPSRRLSEERLNRSYCVPTPNITNQQAPGSSFSLRKKPKSPGRDSPGHDSNASSVTLGSAASSGCRNSTTSLDSGRASNSAADSIRHAPLPNSRLSYQSSNSSFRTSFHSSSSSSVTSDQDGICTLNVQDMFNRGHPDHEILNAWLTDLHFEEYYNLFLSAGYDMPTISRMTPEDLTAIGIKKPNHRKRLKIEIAKLNIGDGLPDFIPESLEEWLHYIRLSEYGPHLRSQGYNSIHDVSQITIEDLEDVGIYRLGHQKRFLLAIKRNKDLKTGRRIAQSAEMLPHPPPSPAPSFHRAPVFSSFQQQPPAPPPRLTEAMTYCPEVIRIEQHPPPPAPTKTHALPPDMPRPMPLFQRQNSFGVPLRSYDDADILRAADESVLIHHNSGGGTLPRLKGLVNNKPRPVAKIIAKTREVVTPSKNDHEQDDDLKKNNTSLGAWPSPPTPLELNPAMRNCQYRMSTSPPPPPPPELDMMPFANENAGTIRMRSNSHTNDVSTYNWHQSQDETTTPSSHKQQQPQPPTTLKRAGSVGGTRSAGDVLNDIGSMLADLTDELDAMLHMERGSENGQQQPTN